jgi:hypothetical protein
VTLEARARHAPTVREHHAAPTQPKCVGHLAALWLILGALTSAGAQGGVTTAAISGTVSDQHGRSVAAADIEVVNRATGFTSRLRSHEDGWYVVSGLEVGGPYSVIVRRVGYQMRERNGLFLRLGQSRRADIRLDEQAVMLQSILTAANETGISRTQAGVGTLVSDANIHRLPTADRDLFGFLRLAPQVSTSYGPSAAGTSPRMNAFMIDGASEQGLFGGVAAGAIWGGKAISLEAVKEYEVLFSPYDVRQGNFAGALVNTVTRNGTNDLHGSAFYYGRYEALSRNVPFIRDARYQRTQAGFSLGGPLVRNRAHFFVATEFQRMVFPAVGPYIGQRVTRTPPLPVDAGDVERFQRAFEQWGLAPGSGGPVTGDDPLTNVFARVDVALPSWNSRLVLRENYGRSDSMAFSRPSPPPTPNCPTPACFPLSSVARRYVIEKSGLVGQLFTSFRNGASNELFVGRLGVTATISPVARQPLVVVLVPRANQDTASLQAGSYELSQVDNTNNQSAELTDNLTLPIARHRLTIGITGQRFHVRRLDLRGAYGIWQFSSVSALEQGTALSYRVAQDFGGADVTVPGGQFAAYIGDQWEASPRLTLILGLRADLPVFSARPPYAAVVDSVLRRRTDAIPSGRVQWSPRAGFNVDAHGDGRTIVRGGVGAFLGRPPLQWIGNAFQNYGRPRTLTCGGARGMGPVPVFSPDYINPPLACGNGARLTSNNVGAVNLVDPHLRLPHNLRASIGVEQHLPGDLVAGVDAMYSRALHELLFVNRTLGPPDSVDRHGRALYGAVGTKGQVTTTRVVPRFDDVIELTNQSRDHSYSVTGRVTKQFSTNADADVSVTYARARDVQSQRLTRNPAFDNWRFGRIVSGRHDLINTGVSDFDVPYRVVATSRYALPWRWTTDLSVYYIGSTGFPFTYVAGGNQNSGDLNADGTNVNDPIYIPRSAYDPDEIQLVASTPGQDTVQRAALERFIDGARCLRRQRARIMERNSCRTPWTNTLNLSIRQSLPVAGTHTVSAELQVFNLLNLLNSRWGHVALPGTVNTVTAQVNLLSQVGQTAGSRLQSQPTFRFDPSTRRFGADNVDSYYQIQLAARYSF